MSQFNEIIAAEGFQRRLAKVRSALDLLTEAARSEFGTLVDEVQQQYKLWQGNDAKIRLLADDLRLIAKSVAFELDDWPYGQRFTAPQSSDTPSTRARVSSSQR